MGPVEDATRAATQGESQGMSNDFLAVVTSHRLDTPCDSILLSGAKHRE